MMKIDVHDLSDLKSAVQELTELIKKEQVICIFGGTGTGKSRLIEVLTEHSSAPIFDNVHPMHPDGPAAWKRGAGAAHAFVLTQALHRGEAESHIKTVAKDQGISLPATITFVELLKPRAGHASSFH